jgi:phage regulator Rha-like protein
MNNKKTKHGIDMLYCNYVKAGMKGKAAFVPSVEEMNKRGCTLK